MSTLSSTWAVGGAITGAVVGGWATDVLVVVDLLIVADVVVVVVVVAVEPDAPVPHALTTRSAAMRRLSPTRRLVLCRIMSMGFMGRHDRPKG